MYLPHELSSLGMNLDKTKIMFNEFVMVVPAYINSILLDVVRKYVYLGHFIKLGRQSFEKDKT